MTEAARARLDLFADLTLEVDGSPVTVTADGAEVLVAVAAPAVVLDAVLGLPLPVGTTRRGVRRRLAGAVDAATAHGVDIVVTGPTGVLVTLGSQATPSRLTRWVTGTDRVALGPWAAVRGPAGTVVRRRVAGVVATWVTRLRHRR